MRATGKVSASTVPRDTSPADPVQKLKNAETENCIRRLTRAIPPGGFPRNVTSKFKFEPTRDVLFSFLSLISLAAPSTFPS